MTSDINDDVLKSVDQSGEKSLSEVLKTWKEHGEELQKECDYDTVNHEYYCEQCKKSFSNKLKLKNHIKYVHNEKTFTCKECPKIYQTQRNLRAHVQTQHEKKLNECSVCKKKYDKKHINRHELQYRKEYTKDIEQHYVSRN